MIMPCFYAIDESRDFQRFMFQAVKLNNNYDISTRRLSQHMVYILLVLYYTTPKLSIIWTT